MKNLPLFLFSFMLLLISCSKSDPCEGIACKNGGTCSDGSCQCPPGWEGPLCETESLPKAVNVTAIKVTKFPANKADGSKWDNDNTNPDIFPALYTLKSDNTADQVLWTSDAIKLNAPTGQTHDFTLILPKLSMKTYDKSLGLFLLEKDDTSSENMGGIAFKLQDVVKGKPATITLDCATCKVASELKVSYE
ncbi:MAG: calcium-binding EGF-like domain-containing protein [Saprospiraceae bacterium]|jgi:hypothetical protein|nr:calcium-binding EGF-like domain-containing protein [Saprospiraceae bacterium]